jgi:hypothetical protein
VQVTVHQLAAWIGGEVACQATGDVDPAAYRRLDQRGELVLELSDLPALQDPAD